MYPMAKVAVAMVVLFIILFIDGGARHITVRATQAMARQVYIDIRNFSRGLLHDQVRLGQMCGCIANSGAFIRLLRWELYRNDKCVNDECYQPHHHSRNKKCLYVGFHRRSREFSPRETPKKEKI